MSLFSRATVRNSIVAAAAVLIAGSGVAVPAHAATPEATGTISGHVLLEGPPDYPPTAGTEVYLFPPTVSSETPTVIATTTTDGTFTADVIPDLSYVVAAQVEDGVHVPRNLGATSRYDPGTAFTVAAGETLVLPAYVLPLGATISGHVKTDDGAPVPVGAYQEFVGYTDTMTDENGDYTIRGLDPTPNLDTYIVGFGSDGDGGMAQWWRNSPTMDGAETIVITSIDDAVTGIDADLRTPRANPLDSAPCLDRSTLTLAKATTAARAYLRAHHDLAALKTLTRADVRHYLARCA
ncbi:carboxypeptidase-like regulatory domain-containing protein [Microbacterium sp. 22296]|uniref:carboxypeptidase-like regulatory domain-containing protein n=1 Tax=Microbacterium sp. 22296 TaxID=3453903 RepID=UPI003F841617